MKSKTIVSVLDPTPATNDVALTRALSLAEWHDAELHVVDVGASRPAVDGGPDAARDALADRVDRAIRSSGAAGVAVTPAVLAGPPVRALADYADRVAADLVVVSREARRGDGYWTAGSFATALGTALAAPTMAVSSPHTHPAAASPFRQILAAVDFSEASLRALSAALALAQESAGQLRLLHVVDGFSYDSTYSGAHALRLINEFRARVTRVNRELRSLVPPDAFNWSDIDVETVSGTAHGAIVTAAAERPTDLIVLGLPRRHRLEQLVAGSTAHKVVRRATAPVLLVPGPATPVLHRRGHPAGDLFARTSSMPRSRAADAVSMARAAVGG